MPALCSTGSGYLRQELAGLDVVAYTSHLVRERPTTKEKFLPSEQNTLDEATPRLK